MRAFKKITALFLALTLMASMFTVTAFADVTFNDVDENTAFYEAIMDLVDQGVINGYNNEDGTTSFKPEATITRAEFTKMLIAASVSPSALTATTTTYSDVATGENAHWALSYIAYASQAKIINGYEDGTFRPENPVTFAEAVKMIVCSLGYTEAVVGKSDPWYEVYLTTGKSTGVTKGALAPADTPAQRGMIAQLIRNMLDCKPLEFAGYDADGKEIFKQGNESFQESVMNAQSEKGVFMGYYENTITGSDEGLTLSDVYISKQKYKLAKSMQDTDFSPYLGKAVTYTYNNDKQITSVKLDKNNEVLVVDCDDIYDFSNGVFKYYDSENMNETLKVDSNPYVIYNGKSVKHEIIDNEWIETYAMADCGQIRFISNDSDSAYEVLFIDSYEIYYVNTPAKNKDVVTLTDQITKTQIVLEEDDCTVTRVSTVGGTASASTLSSISAKSVVAIAKPLNSDRDIKVVYSTAKVSGNVSGKSEYNYVTVNSTEYETSAYFRDIVASDPEKYGYSVGDNVTFYFDFLGKIVLSEVTTATEPYGYITVAAKKGTMDGVVQLKVLPSTGSTLTLNLKSQVKIDGEPYSAETALEVLKETAKLANPNNESLDAKYQAQQLIKYKTGTENGETVISTIYTAAGELEAYAFKSTSDETAKPYANYLDEENAPAQRKPQRKLKYMSNNTFGTNETSPKMQFMCDTKTVVFTVPSDRTQVDKFRKSNFSSSSFSQSSAYAIEPYEYDKSTGAPEAIVYYASTTSTSANVSVITKPVVVQNVNPARNEETGEDVKELFYVEFGKDVEIDVETKEPKYSTALTEENNTLDGVEPGDIIKFVKESGVITKYQMVYDKSAGKLYDYGSDLYTPVYCAANYFVKPYKNDTDYYQVLNGTVCTNNVNDEGAGSIIACPTFAEYDEENEVYTLDTTDRVPFNAVAATKYYTVDMTGRATDIASGSNALTPAIEGAENLGTKVVIVVMNGDILGVVTYVD